MIALWILLLAVLLLAALAYLQIYPHRPLALVALAPALLSIGLIARPGLFVPILILDGVLAVIVLIDTVSLPRKGDLSAERQVGRIASVRKPHRVTLTLVNRSTQAFLVTVRDGAPAELEADPPVFSALLEPRSRSTVHYTLLPRRRGALRLENVYLRVRSRWGL